MKEDKVIRGLSLSGGGAKGAFVGGMLEYMKMEKGMDFDLYSGTSTGTLLQTLTSINRFDLLKEGYTSITSDDIYEISPFKEGKDPENPKINILGLLKMHFIEKEPTFGDSSKLKELITRFFPKELFDESLAMGKTLIAAVSNLDTAQTETYLSTETTYEEFCDWSWISCNAVPFTSLVKRNDMYYADGGFTEHIPIRKLIEMGATEITAITTKTLDYKPVSKDFGRNPLSLLSRMIDVLLWESSERDLEVVKQMALEKDVTLNIYYMPRNLTDNSMYFDKALMTQWWNEGYEHAKELFDGHKNSSKSMMAKQCVKNYKLTKNDYDARELKSILERSTDGFWDWKINEGTEFLSEKFKNALGYTDDEMGNNPESWQVLCNKGDLKKLLSEVQKHFDSNGEYPFEVTSRYKHKKGHWVKMLCKGSVIEWDEKGNPLRMQGIHTIIKK